MRYLGRMKIISFARALAPGLALSLACPPASAETLLRRAILAGNLGPATGDVAILEVVPGATAQKLGIAPGDLIVAINGRPTDSPLAVVRAMEPLHGGDSIRIDYRRDGVSRTARGKSAARPLEKYPDATVKYGANAIKGGAIRDIRCSASDRSRDGRDERTGISAGRTKSPSAGLN